MKLRGQYTLVIGGLVFSSLVVFGAVLLAEQRRYSREVGSVAAVNLADALGHQIEKHGLAIGAALAARLVEPFYNNNYELIAEEAAEQRSYPGLVTSVVVDAAGVVVREKQSFEDVKDNRGNLPWVREALTTGRPATASDPGILHIAVPVISSKKVVLGAALIDLAMDGIRSDIQIEQARLDGLFRSQSTAFSLTGIALGILLVTFTVLSAIAVAGRLSRPVVAFASRARRIGRGELMESEGLRRRDEIGDLSRAFDEMAAALKETTVSKDYFDNVLRSMADMLLVADADGRITNANPSCLVELGCGEETLRGLRVDDLLPGFSSAANGHIPQGFELRRPGGGQIPVRVSAAPLATAAGKPSGYVLVMQNISERVAHEKQIERSLAEKEILLREIHHRVKNNLQIISSMLSLQSDRSADPGMREVFQESEVRIRAMALVHEQLYRSGDLAHVDLANYLSTLAQQVIRYFGRGDCRIDVRVDEAVREVTVDQAIPIGLIVNELIANSVQHGLSTGRASAISVGLTGDADARRLVVTDNGAGIPPDFDIEASDSLGLKLVRALTDQLGGTFRMHSDGGTHAVVVLPGIKQEGRNEGEPAAAGRRAETAA